MVPKFLLSLAIFMLCVAAARILIKSLLPLRLSGILLFQENSPPNPVWDFLSLLSVLTASAILLNEWVVIFVRQNSHGQELETLSTVSAIIGSAWIASVGWAYSSHRADIMERRTRTYTTFMNIRNSDVWEKHHRMIVRALAQVNARTNDGPMDANVLDAFCRASEEGGALTGRSSLTYRLNYYEFLALGVRTGSLDPDIFIMGEKSVLMKDYELFYLFIRNAAGAQNSKNQARTSAFEHYIWLVNWLTNQRRHGDKVRVQTIRNRHWSD